MATREGTSGVRLLWRATVVVQFGWVGFVAHDLVVGSYPPDLRAVAWVGLVGFLALYLPPAFTGVHRPEHVRDPVVRIVACAVLAAGLLLVVGPVFGSLVTYAAYLAGGSIRRGPLVAASAVVAVSALGAVAAVVATGDPFSALWALYSLMAGGYGVGFAWLAATCAELDRARTELARLAVADERLRFARDLHDLLGHSLSVIALKSDLAGRLIERDPERAGREVGDIETVTREALAEVRAAVTGYRGAADLAGELERARVALAAAGVEAQIDGSPVPLAAEVEELLAWTVREGTTNIVRHAGARRAAIRVDGSGVEIIDDGSGRCPTVIGAGNGLDGLAERVARLDGRFEAGDAPGGGFRLAVRAPDEQGVR